MTEHPRVSRMKDIHLSLVTVLASWEKEGGLASSAGLVCTSCCLSPSGAGGQVGPGLKWSQFHPAPVLPSLHKKQGEVREVTAPRGKEKTSSEKTSTDQSEQASEDHTGHCQAGPALG